MRVEKLKVLVCLCAFTLPAMVMSFAPVVTSVTPLPATEPVVAYQEHYGAVRQVEALATLIPADAIVLFPRSAAGMRLSLPLRYLGERGTFAHLRRVRQDERTATVVEQPLTAQPVLERVVRDAVCLEVVLLGVVHGHEETLAPQRLRAADHQQKQQRASV